ncbi:MAG: menaquinone biosynthesis decarboxylase [Phycisphaerales bacterium]|nr:menaquinone biosynthesis decarboxylase [Phycisphaerales bacterium]
MAYSDLQTFLKALDQAGQLSRVTCEVDPVLEIAEIADRVCKSPAAGNAPPPAFDAIHGRRGGRGLLFERVRGSGIPCAINVYGSYERMRMALGCDSFESMADRVQSLIKPDIPTNLLDKIRKLPELAKIAGFGPKVVKRGICQEVVHTDDASLFDLPIIQCWPLDGQPGQMGKSADSPAAGRYITFAGIYTKDRDTGERNVGMYRVQVFEPRMTAMHWHMHHDGPRHHRKYQARGEKMPLAIVLGGDSVLPYAATCPLPPDVSELLFAGFLNDTGIELVPCKTIPMEVPANAEIVIEGLVEPKETITEGPFGDHTGFYSVPDRYPVFRVTAITHRRNPVYPTTIVGMPPQEDYCLGKCTERIFLPLLRIIVPDIIDYSLPMFGAFHNCVFVKIAKHYPYHARKVMSSIWGAGQMMFTKMIVVVDEDVNVHDEQDVLFHLCANVDWRRDTVIVDGPVDILDHAAPFEGAGSKIGIDATRKIPGEGIVRPYPPKMEMSAEVKALVTRRWGEYGMAMKGLD